MSSTLPALHLFSWNQPFWDSASSGSLELSRCARCGHCDGLPQIACSECHSFDREWIHSTGFGWVYSWTETFYSFHPDFSDVPFIVALVDLADISEARLACMATPDVSAESLEINAQVRCSFGAAVNAAGVPILTFEQAEFDESEY